ncbi:tetratricopeptide repeat protein [bacterium]|nr:MAG: tetratricopeptide repeat protein [bacterium]
MVRRSLAPLALAALAACASRGTLVDPLKSERALFESGRFAEAAAALTPERLRSLPKRSRGDGHALIAHCLEAVGRSDDALAAYQLAEALYPKNLEALTGLGWLLHRQGLDDRARPLFERAVHIHPNNATANLGLAEIQRAQGDLASAQVGYESALADASWSKNPAVLRDYAELLASRQKPQQAAEAIGRALVLDPSAGTLLSAARIERRRGGIEAAYRDVGYALSGDPTRDDIALQRALWLLEDGRLAEAEADAEAVLARSDDALARWVRGSARARRGDLAGARADLASAASQRREHPFVARAALALLEELHAPAN